MPPALTKGIKALEADFGAPLFFREGRRILVSDFGHSMLPHLRTIPDEAATTQALAENFRLLQQVPIRLEMISTIGHLRLAQFLSGFERAHPGIELAPCEVTPGRDYRPSVRRRARSWRTHLVRGYARDAEHHRSLFRVLRRGISA